LLFSPADNQLVDLTGRYSGYTGTDPWTVTLTGLGDTSKYTIGDEITFSEASSITNTNTLVVSNIVSSSSIQVIATGGTTPSGPGPSGLTITNIEIINITVQNNAVLSTWPEGYVYATLREYYIKRHNKEDAAIYQAKFDDAWNQVEDQNNKGKWSGGHTRFSSVWQPRQYRQYNIK
jgi:hypothetical protein